MLAGAKCASIDCYLCKSIFWCLFFRSLPLACFHSLHLAGRFAKNMQLKRIHSHCPNILLSVFRSCSHQVVLAVTTHADGWVCSPVLVACFCNTLATAKFLIINKATHDTHTQRKITVKTIFNFFHALFSIGVAFYSVSVNRGNKKCKRCPFFQTTLSFFVSHFVFFRVSFHLFFFSFDRTQED